MNLANTVNIWRSVHCNMLSTMSFCQTAGEAGGMADAETERKVTVAHRNRSSVAAPRSHGYPTHPTSVHTTLK